MRVSVKHRRLSLGIGLLLGALATESCSDERAEAPAPRSPSPEQELEDRAEARLTEIRERHPAAHLQTSANIRYLDSKKGTLEVDFEGARPSANVALPKRASGPWACS